MSSPKKGILVFNILFISGRYSRIWEYQATQIKPKESTVVYFETCK